MWSERTMGVATYQGEGSTGLCLVRWRCTLERSSSLPIMLSIKRIVSTVRRFPVSRAYSNAAPANDGMRHEELCMNSCL